MMARLFVALLVAATVNASAQVPPQAAAGSQSSSAQTKLNLPVISRRVAGPFYLNIPFNIQAPSADLKIIQVACTVFDRSPNVPGTVFIGYGSGTVQIDGKAVTGAVDVFFKPFKDDQSGAPRSLEDARHYRCNLIVSNGMKLQAAAISAGYLPNVEPWATALPGSVVKIEGPLDF